MACGIEEEKKMAIPKLYATPEAAPLMGQKPPTLEKWRCYRTGPEYVKLGGKVFYTEEAISNWIARNTRGGAKPAHGGKR